MAYKLGTRIIFKRRIKGTLQWIKGLKGEVFSHRQNGTVRPPAALPFGYAHGLDPLIQTFWVKACLVLAIWGLLGSLGYAQEIYFLGLTGAGSSSVIVSKDQQTAFITDGGKAGNAGINGAFLDNKPILDYLADSQVKHLYLACSHPHSDHQAGLIQLVKQPVSLSQKFQSLDFISSGFRSDSKGGSLSLAQHYNQAAAALPEDQKKSLIKPGDFSDKKDGLIFHYGPQGGIEVKYFGPLDPSTAKPDAHGAALISQAAIKNSQGATCLVDFDDASPERTTAWLNEHAAEMTGSGAKWLAVIPHHGSDAEKIDEILKAKFDGCIIAVDPVNEYGHPGPRNLDKIVSRFGRDKVFFTGAEGNLVITPGKIPSPHKDFAAIFRSFIQPQREYVDLKLREKEETLLRAIRDAHKKAAQKANAEMQPLLESQNAINNLETVFLAPERASAPAQAYELPHGTLLEKRDGDSHTGTWDSFEEETQKRMQHRHNGQMFGITSDELYLENEQYYPLAGGVIAGGKVLRSDVKPFSAMWTNSDSDGTGADGKQIVLLVQTDQGTCRYDTATYTEFFAAQQLVEQQGVTLVSGNYDSENNPYFDVNPVIADTLVAWYAMQLDSFLEDKGDFNIASQVGFTMPKWKKLVWIDRQSDIKLHGDRLEVVADADGSDILYKVLIKDYTEPAWWAEYSKDPEAYILKDPDIAKCYAEYNSLLDKLHDRTFGSSQTGLILSQEEHRLELLRKGKELNNLYKNKQIKLFQEYETYSWDHTTTREKESDAINTAIHSVAREFVGLRRVNEFAKTVALLRWLKVNNITLPTLSSNSATFLNVPNNLSRADYLPENVLFLRGEAKSGAKSFAEAIAILPDEGLKPWENWVIGGIVITLVFFVMARSGFLWKRT